MEIIFEKTVEILAFRHFFSIKGYEGQKNETIINFAQRIIQRR